MDGQWERRQQQRQDEMNGVSRSLAILMGQQRAVWLSAVRRVGHQRAAWLRLVREVLRQQRATWRMVWRASPARVHLGTRTRTRHQVCERQQSQEQQFQEHACCRAAC